MAKTYTITVRDLSNEAKVIKAREEEIKYFRETVTKEIEVLGASHSTAIISYFNHQLDEIEKITDSFGFYYGFYDMHIQIIMKKGKRILDVTPFGSFPCKDFDLKSKSVVISSEYLETLLRYWNDIKTKLNEAIQFKLDLIEKENENAESDLAYKLHVYNNFQI